MHRLRKLPLDRYGCITPAVMVKTSSLTREKIVGSIHRVGVVYSRIGDSQLQI
jgi:hypothetical protein